MVVPVTVTEEPTKVVKVLQIPTLESKHPMPDVKAAGNVYEAVPRQLDAKTNTFL